MTAKKNTTEEPTQKFPETFEQLVKEYPELNGLPKLVRACDFNAGQSADFTVLLTLLDTQMPNLDGKDPMDAALVIARVVSISNDFYKGLATDKKAYEKWATGRDGNVLFSAFLNLSMFYRIELGKSEASRTPTETAQSN